MWSQFMSKFRVISLTEKSSLSLSLEWHAVRGGSGKGLVGGFGWGIMVMWCANCTPPSTAPFSSACGHLFRFHLSLQPKEHELNFDDARFARNGTTLLSPTCPRLAALRSASSIFRSGGRHSSTKFTRRHHSI